jgi:hypothetical protein
MQPLEPSFQNLRNYDGACKRRAGRLDDTLPFFILPKQLRGVGYLYALNFYICQLRKDIYAFIEIELFFTLDDPRRRKISLTGRWAAQRRDT